MKKKLVFYQPLLRKCINLLRCATRKVEAGRFLLSFFKNDLNLGKYYPVCLHLLVKFSF